MALVDLELAKGHLRVLHNDDDAEIGVYLAAAESIVVEYLDRPVLEVGATLPDPNDDSAIIVTSPIVAAILLTLGDLYENRETQEDADGEAVMPPAVRRLLAPWRVWRTFVEDVV